MRFHLALTILAVLVSLFTACSKHSQTAASLRLTDIGVVAISDGIPIHCDLGGSRACVITPTVTRDGSLRLAYVIAETNSDGVVRTLATPGVESTGGGPVEVIVGNIAIRLTPKVR
jgi:hypothetical protein